MRRQYYFRPSPRGLLAWDVDRLIQLSMPFPRKRVRLEQALGNLVENALRHGRGRITLRALPADGAVELHVADEGNGLGLEPELALQPFARGDDAAASGAGLGLAIVDVIARAHRGAVHAGATRAGTDVWLSLPG